MAHTNATSDETAHAGPRYDDINTPVVVMWGFISAVLTLATFLTLTGVYNIWHQRWVDIREGQYVSIPAVEEVAEQKKLLEGGEGTVAIGEAMNQVVQKFGGSH